MDELHLVLLFDRQRACLRDSLGRRVTDELGLLDSALAKLQFRLALD